MILITYDKFIDTGRFTPMDVYLKEYPRKTLHPDCAEVIIYIDGFIIQVLKTNEFYTKVGRQEIRHKSLDCVESALWYLKANKVINRLK